MKTFLKMGACAGLVAFTAAAGAATYYAPYVDVGLWPTPQIDDIGVQNGLQQFNLAFVVAQGTGGTCTPSWAGVAPIGPGQKSELGDSIKDSIKRYRAKGGEVAISFGGASNVPLAQACQSVEALQKAYDTVLNEYAVDHIDFDIEGGAQTDMASIERRFAAVTKMQQQRAAGGRPLHVTLTLPVLPTGLTADGVAVLDAALRNGTDLDALTVMAMDYGPAQVDMAQAAKDATLAVHRQLDLAYKTAGQVKTDAELWQKIGITPMIGVNDITTEVFSIADAGSVKAFADRHDLGMFGIWSIARDHRCANGASNVVDLKCSSVEQTEYLFSQILGQNSGHWGTGVTKDPSYVGGGGDSAPVAGAEWNRSKVYNGGDTVTYKGQLYQALWWTKGEIPGTSTVWQAVKDTPITPDTGGGSGGDTGGGSGGDTGGGHDSGGGGSADTGGDTGGGSGGGSDAKPIPDAAWSARQIYNSGDTVTHRNRHYAAQWWNLGEVPGTAPVWRFVSGPLPEWSSSSAYQAGECVMYQNARYCANWWSQGTPPDSDGAWRRAQ